MIVRVKVYTSFFRKFLDEHKNKMYPVSFPCGLLHNMTISYY